MSDHEVVIIDIHFRGEAEIRQFEGTAAQPFGAFLSIRHSDDSVTLYPADRIVSVHIYVEKRYSEE